MKREVHLRELQLLDAVRRRFMHHQQTQKEAELRRLDDEIERKVGGWVGGGLCGQVLVITSHCYRFDLRLIPRPCCESKRPGLPSRMRRSKDWS